MFDFIRRIFVRDFGPPPPPDVTQLPTYSRQRIVEMLYSHSKRERAIITVDDTGHYRIFAQSWDTSDWEYCRMAHWYGHQSGSHTDSLPRARQLAEEALRCSGAPRTESVRASDLQPGPIRHERLSEAMDARIRKFEPVFAEVCPRTHEEWLDGFQRDLDPEPEIVIWERMANAYQTFTEKRSLSLDAKREALGLLLMRSTGDEQQTLSSAKLKHLSRADAEDLLRLYSAAP